MALTAASVVPMEATSVRRPAAADDAQRDLDQALPALDAAVASLKNLSRNDIVEVSACK